PSQAGNQGVQNSAVASSFLHSLLQRLPDCPLLRASSEGRLLSTSFFLSNARLLGDFYCGLRASTFRVCALREHGNLPTAPLLLLLFMLLGGLLGGILGEILRIMAPHGTIQNIFSTAITPGISPPLSIDLILFKFTVGFSVKINLLTFLGLFTGAYLYKQF